MDKKPGLMIAVLEGLKKKGKMDPSKGRPSKMDDLEKEDDVYDSESYREHLEEVSKELISAVMAEDHMAVADLLEEAFDCMEQAPHKEGPHLGEDEEL